MIYGRFAVGLVGVAVCLLLAGCGGATGRPENKEPLEIPPAVYSGLGGQTVAIMVWADSITRAEYNRIQVDLATALQNRIQPPPAAADGEKDKKEPAKDKKSEAAPMVFVPAASVVRFQRAHPELDGLPITEVAARLGASRVIYIELEDFQTYSPKTIMLLKGQAKATLRVVEVVGGKATIVLEERGIEALFPPRAPEGVMASDKHTIRTVYEGTVLRLADKLALRFSEKKK
jgi:hypothetical protein